MSIVITFEATAKVGEEKELLAFLVDTLADTRKFEGCIKVDAHGNGRSSSGHGQAACQQDRANPCR